MLTCVDQCRCEMMGDGGRRGKTQKSSKNIKRGEKRRDVGCGGEKGKEQETGHRMS